MVEFYVIPSRYRKISSTVLKSSSFENIKSGGKAKSFWTADEPISRSLYGPQQLATGPLFFSYDVEFYVTIFYLRIL